MGTDEKQGNQADELQALATTEVSCAPEILEIALFYTAKDCKTYFEALECWYAAIGMITNCQDGHFGDECILCTSHR